MMAIYTYYAENIRLTFLRNEEDIIDTLLVNKPTMTAYKAEFAVILVKLGNVLWDGYF